MSRATELADGLRKFAESLPAYGFNPKPLQESADELERLDRANSKLERTERNRDMWKQQCFQQAEALREMRQALQEITRMDYGNPYARECANTARAALTSSTGDTQ